MLGAAKYLVGTPIWAVAGSALLMNAGDFFYLTPFSWALFGIALAGLALSIGGFRVYRAGGRLDDSMSLNLR